MIPRLTHRLQQIADMVDTGSVICDIGCDHGLVPVYLAQKGVCKKAIAMDVKPGPLEHAKENIEEFCCGQNVEIRLSDGFEALKPKEADTIIIAGMGGHLMKNILEAGYDKWSKSKYLILSPHTEAELIREYLQERACCVDEKMVCEDEKYYVISKYAVGLEDTDYTKAELLYGRVLIKKREEIFLNYLKYKLEKYETTLEKLKENDTPKAALRKKEVEEEIRILKGV